MDMDRERANKHCDHNAVGICRLCNVVRSERVSATSTTDLRLPRIMRGESLYPFVRYKSDRVSTATRSAPECSGGRGKAVRTMREYGGNERRRRKGPEKTREMRTRHRTDKERRKDTRECIREPFAQ